MSANKEKGKKKVVCEDEESHDNLAEFLYSIFYRKGFLFFSNF